MLSTRANTICVLEILKEFSDEEHILSMGEIISKMSIIYGLKIDRRTVYSAVSLLGDLGYDISIYEENGSGYYLRGRDLEKSEILLLTDAVYSFTFLPPHQSEDLIEKLQKQLSVHQRKKYRHLTIVRPDRKSSNRQVFFNMELLDEAVTNKKKVSFTYLEYGTDKKLHPRRNKAYIVNPYGMVYMNENYYLICNLCGYPETSLYRIDLISDILCLDEDWDKEPEHNSYIRDTVFAFSGKPEHITLHCDKSIIGDVLVKFGTDVKIMDRDENTFVAAFTAPPRGIKFWALQYLPYAEVIEPKWLRDEIIDSIRKNKYGE